MMQNEPENSSGSIGSLIGIILIIAIIVLGGIYFWGKSASQGQNGATIESLETDLDSVDVSVDSDLGAIDQDLQGQ